MRLPVFKFIKGALNKPTSYLNFENIGDSHELIANEEKLVGVKHGTFKGYPHPICLVLPEGSTSVFELRDNMLIYVKCDKEFRVERQHGRDGPYQVYDIEPEEEVCFSGIESSFVRINTEVL